jgi:protein-S-isoprenylcysteine O-methyltransferase Ste14
MHINDLIVTILWVTFMIVWLASSFTAKRSVRGPDWWKGWGIRAAIIIAIYLVIHLVLGTYPNAANPQALSGLVMNPVLATIGTILCAIGIAFAFWARYYLGRNWGMPMTVREEPELVTGGPYAYVRHPIYTGVITAMLGSAFVDWWWYLPFVVSLIYFSYSAFREEKLMTGQFPQQYPPYKARTKMLIPFIF